LDFNTISSCTLLPLIKRRNGSFFIRTFSCKYWKGTVVPTLIGNTCGVPAFAFFVAFFLAAFFVPAVVFVCGTFVCNCTNSATATIFYVVFVDVKSNFTA
jgi:hypothetical protein